MTTGLKNDKKIKVIIIKTIIIKSTIINQSVKTVRKLLLQKKIEDYGIFHKTNRTNVKQKQNTKLQHQNNNKFKKWENPGNPNKNKLS